MANAAGGRIIYGIAEGGQKNNQHADSFSPVTDEAISADWITQVVASRTSPPIPSIRIQSVPKDSGRIFVVDVEQGGTAHQSLYDHVYYQRIGAQVLAMQDFQVRDVMNRRSGPILNIALRIKKSSFPNDDGRGYLLYPVIENVGQLTVNNWRLQVLAPQSAYYQDPSRVLIGGHRLIALSQERSKSGDCNVYTYSSGALAVINKDALHPGEVLELQGGSSLPEIGLKVHAENFEKLRKLSASIYWRFYSLNARPILGELKFEDWCDF